MMPNKLLSKLCAKIIVLFLGFVFTHSALAQLNYIGELAGNKAPEQSAEAAAGTLETQESKELLRQALIEILGEPAALKTEQANEEKEQGESYLSAEGLSEQNRQWALSSFFNTSGKNSNAFRFINKISTNVQERFKVTFDNWQYLGPQLNILKRKIFDYQGTDGLIKLLLILSAALLVGVLFERVIYRFVKKRRNAFFLLCKIAQQNTDRELLQSQIDKDNAVNQKAIVQNNQLLDDKDNVLGMVVPEDDELSEEIKLSDNDLLDIALKEQDDLRLNLMTKVKSVVSIFLLDAIRLFGFALGAFLVPSLSLGNDTVLMEEFILACVTQISIFLFFVILFRSFIQPSCSYLRLFKLDDKEAKLFFKIVMTIFFIDTFGISSIVYFDFWGIDFDFLIVPMLLTTGIINIYVIYNLWRSRTFVLKIFVNKLDINGNPIISRINLYPAVISAAVLWIWFHWIYFLINQEFDKVRILGLAWWITLFFPLIDRAFFIVTNGIVSIYSGNSRALKRRISRIIKTLQIGFRYVLTLAIFYLYLSALDLRAVESFTHFISELLTDVSVTFGFCYILWELVHGYIEHKFPEEENALAALEGEGGGTGATRSETIMPLVRTFLSAILFVIITLVVLSSFGVQIGPLLAGAGIVGIAIGFGAQKLVQDIISGIFFLVDDAFRKGEYIELEEIRGSVEKIALRSMQLRHHLGAVQTVPYSEIRTVKNLSRDWITMKLELRFPYDTDIEKVRKVIKTVGLLMLEDEEMGPSFILPLKSQGVMRVEESALIVRMKFTSKPGEQWIIRREAYRRVKEALEKDGIFFAHREVFVRLPGEGGNHHHDHSHDLPIAPSLDADGNVVEPVIKASTDTITDKQDLSEADRTRLQQAGAAVASSILAAEALKHSKLQDDDDMSE